jgi:CheY-like chemotaxis protein
MKEKLTLLIVDDDKDLLRQLNFLLEDDFEKILLSSSKDKALELIILENIDACLVDVRLSETDASNTEGIELAKEIRRNHSSILIVMMSRYDPEKYEALCKEKDYADDFIRKPFTMEEFIEELKQIKEDRNVGSTSH